MGLACINPCIYLSPANRGGSGAETHFRFGCYRTPSSALTHVASWQTTLYQFADDYNVPLLPPTLAAYLAVAIEFAAPPLLVLGLMTRLTSLVLLGMVAVIEVFVYPQAWPTHIQWAAMLFVLVARGPGSVSLDGLIRRRTWGRGL